MARILFTVGDRFLVQGRGLVAVPGIVPQGSECFRVGDPLLLRHPDGSVLRTAIGGLELLDPNPNHEVVVLFKDLSKDDVPVGTEVWSVDTA
jgi:hypothetical protein